MGQQIIKQPDGKFAVWSSVADGLMLLDMTRAEIESHFAEEAAKYAKDRVRGILDLVDAGRARDAYFQFALTWDKAVKEHNRNFPDEKIDTRPATAKENRDG